MRYLLVFLFILFFGTSVNGQSGYLGSLSAIELKVNAGPSFRRVARINDDLTVSNKLRLFNLNYELSYARTFSKSFEFFIGYRFSSMLADTRIEITGTEPFNNGDILDAPRLNAHGFRFGGKFFRKGSLAPIGKFFLLSFDYQKAKLPFDEDVIYGTAVNVSGENDGFYSRITNILLMDTINGDGLERNSSFNIKGGIGRNYPITDKLIISMGMTFPIITYLTYGNRRSIGVLFNSFLMSIEDGELVRDEVLVASTLKMYNRITLDVGLKLHF
jgi:hypothetical protein